ncbi:MAG: hypothetical protein NVS3B1_20460 [Marmoricola sp.]
MSRNHRTHPAGPVTVASHYFKAGGGAVSHFNSWLALKITAVVGTMWCAYAFALMDLLSLPAAIHGGIQTLVAWIAQTFLQLVLLSIIMVGQNVQAAAADARAKATFDDAEKILVKIEEILGRLT